MNESDATKWPQRAPAIAAAAPVRLDSNSMFAGKRELIIVHQGEEYRLRITRQQKLILTK